MSSPVPETLVNQFFDDIAVGYLNSQDRYRGTAIFPIVAHEDQSGTYAVWAKKRARRSSAPERVPGVPPQRHRDKAETDTFFCAEYADDVSLADTEYNRARDKLALDRQKAEEALDKAFMRLEILAAALAFGDNWSQSDAAGAPWTDTEATDPFADATGCRNGIRAACGRYPNKTVIHEEAAEALSTNHKVVDVIKGTNPFIPLEDLLRRIFKTPLIEIVGAVAEEGEIWEKSTVWMGVVEDRPRRTPCAGFTHMWRAPENNGQIVNVRRFFDQNTDEFVWRARTFVDLKQPATVGPDAGGIITGCIE